MQHSKTIRTVAFVIAIASAFPALAAEPPKYEITGSTQTRFTVPTATGGQTTFGLAGSAARIMDETWQAGARLSFNTGGGLTALLATVGPTYNFGAEDLAETYFATFQAGLSLISGASTTTSLAYSISGGKRFPLSERVLWKPELQVTGTTVGSDRPTINFVPVQISFFY